MRLRLILIQGLLASLWPRVFVCLNFIPCSYNYRFTISAKLIVLGIYKSSPINYMVFTFLNASIASGLSITNFLYFVFIAIMV